MDTERDSKNDDTKEESVPVEKKQARIAASSSVLDKLKNKVRHYVLAHPTGYPETPEIWGKVLCNSIASSELPLLNRSEKAELLSFALNIASDNQIRTKLPQLKAVTYPKLPDVEGVDEETHARALRHCQTYINTRKIQLPKDPDPAKWQKVLENSIYHTIPFTYPKKWLPRLANDVAFWIHRGRPEVCEELKTSDQRPIIHFPQKRRKKKLSSAWICDPNQLPPDDDSKHSTSAVAVRRNHIVLPKGIDEITMNCAKCKQYICLGLDLIFISTKNGAFLSSRKDLFKKFKLLSDEKIKCSKCSANLGLMITDSTLPAKSSVRPAFKMTRVLFVVDGFNIRFLALESILLLHKTVARALWMYRTKFLPNRLSFGETWSCINCTLNNQNCDLYCKVCLAPREYKLDPSDWAPEEIFSFVCGLCREKRDLPDTEIICHIPSGREFAEMDDVALVTMLNIENKYLISRILKVLQVTKNQSACNLEVKTCEDESKEVEKDESQSHEKTWKCYKCSFDNSKLNTDCEMCGTSRRSVKKGSNNEWCISLSYGDRVDVQTPMGNAWIPGVITNTKDKMIYVAYEGYELSEWLSIESLRLAPALSHKLEYRIPSNLRDIERSSYAHLDRSESKKMHEFSSLLYPGRYQPEADFVPQICKVMDPFTESLPQDEQKHQQETDLIEDVVEFKNLYSKQSLLENVEDILAPQGSKNIEHMAQNYIGSKIIVDEREYLILTINLDREYPVTVEYGEDNKQMLVKLDFEKYIMEDKDGMLYEFVVSGAVDDGLIDDEMHVPIEMRAQVSWDTFEDNVEIHMYLYALHYIPNDENGPGERTRKLGILLPNAIQDVEMLDVYLETKNIHQHRTRYDAKVCVEPMGDFYFSGEEVLKLKQMHVKLFSMMMNTPFDNEYRFDGHRVRYIIAPIEKDNIDWNVVNTTVSLPQKRDLNEVIREENSQKRNDFDLSHIFFCPRHNKSRRFYVGAKTRYDLSIDSTYPSDEKPDPLFSTYREYSSKKYKTLLTDEEQPLVEAYQFRPRASVCQEPSAQQKYTIAKHVLLAPETFVALPVPADLIYTLQDIPCTLWMLESLLVTRAFHRFINPSLELAFEDVKRALTASSYDEDVEHNYEVLEFYGDGALKYMAVEYVYLKYGDKSEGDMHPMKAIEISNRKMYRLAKEMGLPKYILVKKYSKKNFKVPGFPVHNDFNKPLSIRDIPYKKAADVVEALLGVAFDTHGFGGAYKFLEWIGHGVEKLPYTHCPENLALLRNVEVSSNVSRLESTLNYKFKHKIYAIKAFHLRSTTHLDLVQEAERLEFLGDSVLDILVTKYIYKKRGKTNPELLTNRRSAIVCNDALAIISAKNKFPDLFVDISEGTEQIIRTFYQKRMHDSVNPPNFEKGLRPVNPFKYSKSMSDIVECIIGAVYLDSDRDLDVVWRVFKDDLHLNA